MSEIRKFESGATRNSDKDKLNLEGFVHPLVLQRFCVYMHRHRFLDDGSTRPGDNWQLGISKDSAIDSGLRHTLDWWLEHRGYESREGLEDALCGILFNVQSYLLTVLEEREKEKSEEFVKNLLGPKIEDTLVLPFANNLTPSEIERYKGIQNAYPPPPPPPPPLAEQGQYVVPEGVEEIQEKPTILSTLKRLGLKLK